MMETVSEKEKNALEALDSAGVEYVRLTHPHASTMALCEGIGEEYGASHCKNLFLTNKSGTRFCLLLMDAGKPFRTSDVSRRLGVTRMSFASPEQLRSVLGAEQGAVSVLSLINPCASKAYSEGALRIVVDGDLMKRGKLCVHPNVDTSTLVIGTDGLRRFIESRGMEFTLLDI